MRFDAGEFTVRYRPDRAAPADLVALVDRMGYGAALAGSITAAWERGDVRVEATAAPVPAGDGTSGLKVMVWMPDGRCTVLVRGDDAVTCDPMQVPLTVSGGMGRTADIRLARREDARPGIHGVEVVIHRSGETDALVRLHVPVVVRPPS